MAVVVTAVIAMVGLAVFLGIALAYASKKFRRIGDPVTEQINALLPQTQCGQCGYVGCRPYADAIAHGQADINQCPPGGAAVINSIADLLQCEPKALNPDNGIEKPRTVAVIDESLCIGCRLCIKACPVDAILGASKQMHTVIASECTGCDLCVPPCPVDCIDMVPLLSDSSDWRWSAPDQVQDHTPKRITEAV